MVGVPRRVIAPFWLAIVMVAGVFSVSGSSPASASPISGTIAADGAPGQVIIAGAKAYVVNAASIRVIDTVTNTAITTIPAPVLAGTSNFDNGVYVPEDQSLWVSRYQSNGGQVIRINTVTDMITHTFTDGVDGQTIKGPAGVAANGSKVYVAMLDNNKIAVFNTATSGSTRDTDLNYTAANSPQRLAVAGDTLYIFQSATPFDVVPWTISTGTQGTAITTGLGAGVTVVSVLPGSPTKIYFGRFNVSAVRSLDVTDNTTAQVVTGLTSPEQITFSPDGSRMFIARSGGITVVRLSDNAVVGNLAVTNGSHGIGVLPGGNTLYLSVRTTNVVSVINLNPTLTTSAASLTINTASTIPAPVATGFWSDPTYTSTALPAGLSLNSSTGAIEGTPTQAGVTTVTLTATNPTMFTRTSTFTITVVDPDAPVPGPESGSGGSTVRGSSSDPVSADASAPILARTGVNMTPSLLVGSFLLVAGVVAWVGAWRSRRGVGSPTS